ncbi:hypothetical protein P7K49_019217 [Saguinus oedipus]|uniref:Prohibitin n=1 Tax=Saguinus oedipus TaxID=9490 RepID=A0ABQ9UX13_SAGOE|nr:hypothetical protein P7K49_019217 [Saguinus oedipus]
MGPEIEACPCVNLNSTHLGEALSKNPGYIKLRKIRAAQNISKTIATSQNRIYLTADNLVLNLQDESFTRAGAAVFLLSQIKNLTTPTGAASLVAEFHVALGSLPVPVEGLLCLEAQWIAWPDVGHQIPFLSHQA